MNIIKEKREEKGLTQREVADLLKLSQPAYFQVENGQRKLKGQLKKDIMHILGLKESDLLHTSSEQLPEQRIKVLTEEVEQLKAELKSSKEIIDFFIQHFEFKGKKEEFIETLWFFVQDHNMITYPEKYRAISKWKSENDALIWNAIVENKAPEDLFPAHIKKLEEELEKIRGYFIEKAMYESKLFKFLKDNRLLNKAEIKHYNSYRNIDPKTVK